MSNSDVEQVARARIASAQDQITRSLARVREGVPLAAEWDTQRLRDRLQAKAALSREEAEAITLGIQAVGAATPEERRAYFKERGPEAIYGKTIDFVGVAFLERGGVAARAVARVAFLDGRPHGSGFLTSDRLFLTNNHVISSQQAAQNLCIEFDYELDPSAQPRGPTRFALDPSAFFVTDPVAGLDYTLIAVGQKLSGPKRLHDYGWCALSNASDKHALGEVANIVQHPDGRYKEVVLRENRLVARLDLVLHYIADTEPGSSGSPVFNNEWEVIALHHWGGPWRQQVDETGRPLDQEVNEGIRISAIVNDLRAKGATLTGGARSLLQRVIQLGESRALPPRVPITDAQPSANWRVGPDGSVSWQIPVELSVRLPALAGADRPATEPLTVAPQPSIEPLAEARLRPNQSYDDRSGYKPRFIERHAIELPRLPPALARYAASNRQRQPGDDPHELKYHHFSIVMNAARRLAFFTACNIDGANAKHVDRDTGDVTPLQADDDRLESIWAASEAAEASETWYDDPRLDPKDYAGRDIYQSQVVPGFPDPRSMGRTLRMFQRGHLVRRMDPAWGSNAMARKADADTFHWTNCSPQVGFFNMGRANPKKAGTGGGKLWRAIENYVLRNAVADQMRVSSFTGPVFGKDDRPFRGIQVPNQFWKIVAWQERGALRSVAMLADQQRVIAVWPEALEGREAYGDPDELDEVQDFLSSVAEVERLTGIDFGDALRSADIRAGERRAQSGSFADIPLGRPTRASRKAKTRRRRRRGG